MKCIDEGYVVMINDKEFIKSNTGIFRSKRNAEERCNKLKRAYPKRNIKLAKVKLMVVEEE